MSAPRGRCQDCGRDCMAVAKRCRPCYIAATRGVPRPRTNEQRGVPVYDEDGNLFARSIIGAGRRLGCFHSAVLLHCVDYGDGLRLVSRPRYTGKRGGPRWKKEPRHA
jgi:hypothetical protein